MVMVIGAYDAPGSNAEYKARQHGESAFGKGNSNNSLMMIGSKSFFAAMELRFGEYGPSIRATVVRWSLYNCVVELWSLES
ncbi:hypothetical protein CC1G_08278 [Coprinopsis cinerea okayama7|uniref:Uncharacterized protein n=1 Tax=Coprinopsis cinerea (strain Okayama-7 / 130 / ATCC MYA-4618 / FGSC 9003) TaxID=240176 RepID=A8PG32_COPC7|nr:hypothetical protein CC1G_08278 [Coprinopsis cinerea okayama7\|eukprot:XP_001841134.2 hypothetical protein CC1G_08278 [Coprinopsis cinerea okayama7\